MNLLIPLSARVAVIDNVMMKFIVNSRTGVLKTDVSWLFAIANNCQIVRFCSLTHPMNKKNIVSVRLLTIKIRQLECENFCNYRKKLVPDIARPLDERPLEL